MSDTQRMVCHMTLSKVNVTEVPSYKNGRFQRLSPPPVVKRPTVPDLQT